MIPSEQIMRRAAENSDTAVVVLGRISGESRDNAIEKGSWYLSDSEEELLKTVSEYFKRTVVLLNVGNIIDMNWVEKYNIKSVMYIWQGGQEGGNAFYRDAAISLKDTNIKFSFPSDKARIKNVSILQEVYF